MLTVKKGPSASRSSSGASKRRPPRKSCKPPSAGTLVKHNPHAFDVNSTALGDFTVVLDTRFARYQEKSDGILDVIGAEVGEVLGSAASRDPVRD